MVCSAPPLLASPAWHSISGLAPYTSSYTDSPMSTRKAIIRAKIRAIRSLNLQGDFRIGAWLIQPQLHTIALEGHVSHVEPKAMQVLVYLAEHPDEVVAKERLIGAVWADTFVTDDVLTRLISELRKAFDDDAKQPRV